MQLYDIIFWKSLEINNGKNMINYTFTKFAMITNHLQPIIFAYLIYQIKTLNNLNVIILSIYTLFSLFYSTYVYNKLDYTLVTDESSPALYWKWNYFDYSNILYGLFLLSLISVSLELDYPLNIIISIINTLSFMFSFYYYKRSNIGRMWCVIAAYVPLFLIILQIK
jgi:hypothetical protein